MGGAAASPTPRRGLSLGWPGSLGFLGRLRVSFCQFLEFGVQGKFRVGLEFRALDFRSVPAASLDLSKVWKKRRCTPMSVLLFGGFQDFGVRERRVPQVWDFPCSGNVSKCGLRET